MAACVHGEVCREYLKRFGWVRTVDKFFNSKCELGARVCILSTICPNDCKFYEPVRPKGLHFKERA